MLEFSLQPDSCICPSDNYTCQADGVIQMEWKSGALDRSSDPRIVFSIAAINNNNDESGGFRAHFTEEPIGDTNSLITSTLLVTNLSVNGSNLTCEAAARDITRDIITICIVGETAVMSIIWTNDILLAI